MNNKLTQGLLFISACCSLLIVLSTRAAFAQQPAHIIVIIQENRSVDNIFQDPTLISRGADISKNATCLANGKVTHPSLQPYNAIDSCFNPDHSHSGGFVGAYDSGDNSWDNACNVPPDVTGSNCAWPGQYANYTYVENSFTSPQSDILGPYFQIAETYGFSNYAFQTNQGPSFNAHQFLFSGTSAAVYYDNDPTGLWKYFAAENPKLYVNGQPTDTQVSGCFSPGGTKVTDVNASGSESYAYTPPGLNSNMYAGFPCYDHPSIADLLDNPTPPNGPITWKYYTNPSQQKISIWTAPNALQEICEAVPNGGTCTSPQGNTDWQNVDDTPGDILNDINNCRLPQVSWVIPDGNWSDHPGLVQNKNGQWGGATGGPSWIAAIVNAIGGYGPGTCTQEPTRYWNGSEPTVVIITWDDWGGWYDHVAPYNPTNDPLLQGGYPNTTGIAAGDGQGYVYGFRVPLLVVAANMAENTTGTPGYISGINHNENPPYVHDFGSILGYIEYVFHLNDFTANTPYPFGIAGGNPTMFPGSFQYPYADFYAPDSPANYVKNQVGCPPSTCPYPLSDFFSNPQPHTFTPIINGVLYGATCFTSPASCFGADYPQDPDNE